jgi:hypothetical protein
MLELQLVPLQNPSLDVDHKATGMLQFHLRTLWKQEGIDLQLIEKE